MNTVAWGADLETLGRLTNRDVALPGVAEETNIHKTTRDFTGHRNYFDVHIPISID